MTQATLRDHLALATRAAHAAGEFLRGGFGKPCAVYRKGPADLVTEMDLRAQETIFAILDQGAREIEIIGEESAGRLPGDDRPYWLVDPLDGTTNYIRHYPSFAVSIALVREGEVVLGVVFNPVSGELYRATRGGGASVNGRELRVSSTSALHDSLLGSGFPYDAWTAPDNNGAAWCRLLRCAISLRCDGSAALDLCHVAAGRFDAYWEVGLAPWDLAAGSLIVAEAGGRVTASDGSGFSVVGSTIVASNGHIHHELLGALMDGRQVTE
jgi:myo-inositol-1(or 4)-monophosphatase